MSRIIKCALASLALLATLGTQTEAALVRVQFDSFGMSDTVFTSGDLTVTRSIVSNDGAAPTILDGNFVLTKASSATISYVVTNGTFGDVFATGPLGAAAFDGFSFNALWTQQSNISNGSGVSISVGGTELVTAAPIVNGDNDFRFIADLTATTVAFTFTNSFPGGGQSAANLVIGNMSVVGVPEPSALLLVGSVLSFGFLRRRRS